MRETIKKALQLCLLALANYVLFYAIGVLLARRLGVSGFKTYSVAVATLTLLASFTTLGLEKYAVRVLPAFYESEDWSGARGFTLFGRNLVLWIGLVVVLVYGAIAVIDALTTDSAVGWPTLLAVLFLPAMVAASFAIEVAAASGRVIAATVIYRLVLPICLLLSLGAVLVSPVALDPAWAVVCMGVSWLAAFALLRRLVHRAIPNEVAVAESRREPGRWLKRSAPFLLHSVMMTQFASLGIVGLELLQSPEQEVALLAAAMQTGGFVVLLATATNRYYGPMASRLIERSDYDGLIATIRERHSWIVPSTGAFLLVVVLFGRKILGLFGPEFELGYAALCWISGGASVSVWFSMAPSYLKFVGRNRMVLGITAAGGALNVLLLVWLGPRHGATGAAAAYAVSLSFMAVTFLGLGLRAARELKSDHS